MQIHKKSWKIYKILENWKMHQWNIEKFSKKTLPFSNSARDNIARIMNLDFLSVRGVNVDPLVDVTRLVIAEKCHTISGTIDSRGVDERNVRQKGRNVTIHRLLRLPPGKVVDSHGGWQTGDDQIGAIRV